MSGVVRLHLFRRTHARVRRGGRRDHRLGLARHDSGPGAGRPHRSGHGQTGRRIDCLFRSHPPGRNQGLLFHPTASPRPLSAGSGGHHGRSRLPDRQSGFHPGGTETPSGPAPRSPSSHRRNPVTRYSSTDHFQSTGESLEDFLPMRRLVLFLFPVCVLAQGITGRVLDDSTGEALVGANIVVAHTFTGTATDQRGEFRLPEVPASGSLVITMMGYERKEIPLPVNSPLTVRLRRDVLEAPRVVVTASRKTQDILESPVSVEVVTPLEIREQGAVSLEEILPYESGVNIIKDQMNIRGASGYTLGAGSRSLLLLDGVPLLGSAAGNITWAVIPTSEIAQVEIVKSGGSALYGSSAMGGVVNIITRNAPPRPEHRFRTRTGWYSPPRYDQWVWRNHRGWFTTNEWTLAAPWGPHGYWIRLQQRSDDGYTQLGWSRALNLTGKIKWNQPTGSTLSLYGNLLADRGGVESQWKSPADPFEAPRGSEHDQGRGTKLNLNGFYNRVFSPRTSLKLLSSVYVVDWRNSGSNTDYSHERKAYLESQVSWLVTPRSSLIVGGTVSPSAIRARLFGNHRGLTGAVYGLWQQKSGARFTGTLGSRWELFWVDGQLRGRALAPQIALHWRLQPGLAVRGSLSTGFRAPTLAERYTSSQLSVFRVEPNPDLSPETSLSGEVGLSWQLADRGRIAALTLDAALYQYRYNNLIEPTPDAYGIIHFENVTRARITGADLSAGLSLFRNRLQAHVSYTWLNPVEVDDRDRVIDTLAYRHRHHFVPQMRLKVGDWTWTVDGRFASAIEKTKLFAEDPVTGRDRRVPIRVWNSSLEWSRKRWQLLFRVENLFQYYYVELERNMGEERSFACTVQYTW
ncbi:MAG: TonB-dependent receptor [Candidatus Neomarinimicrobiota bacterium]|nr:MAG: TonB-dependent receptor [Candidatus Neomarinimicrobiota bacterium]